MPSKKLMGTWIFFDLCLMAAGALSVALSAVWRAPDLMRNLVISSENLTAGTALGIMLLITFVVSVGAIVQRNHVTMGLVILNWFLIADAIAIGVVGSFVWFFTLQERANFHKVWLAQSDATRAQIQDKLSCCGYFFTNDSAVPSQFCTPQILSNATSDQVCVGPITQFADVTLNNIFTSVYGFMAIVLCLFLASLCVINMRLVEERFKKIDAKRGGRGFV